MIYNLIDKFKGLWYSEIKKEIEGYIFMTNNMNNETLLLIKDGEKYWKTKWFNNNHYTYKLPIEQLSTVLKKS
jgi:hypothetical protein